MKLKEVVSRLNEWADWTARNESVSIGYPSESHESRIGLGRTDGKTGKSVVPYIVINPRASAVDRAVKLLGDIDSDLASIVKWKHFTAGAECEKAAAYCEAKGISRTKYFNSYEKGCLFIGGVLAQ